MLEEVFQDVYTKFKLHFYQNVFQRFATREATLTTVESFCMEGIMAMGEFGFPADERAFRHLQIERAHCLCG